MGSSFIIFVIGFIVAKYKLHKKAYSKLKADKIFELTAILNPYIDNIKHILLNFIVRWSVYSRIRVFEGKTFFREDTIYNCSFGVKFSIKRVDFNKTFCIATFQ